MTQAQDAELRGNQRPSAIVIGVGVERGLGAAVCRRFAAQGYHVFVAGIAAPNAAGGYESRRL
jgi:NAD(P)-dependent dehydrogenase (short-subunit alcohol dehydrogenase family)